MVQVRQRRPRSVDVDDDEDEEEERPVRRRRDAVKSTKTRKAASARPRRVVEEEEDEDDDDIDATDVEFEDDEDDEDEDEEDEAPARSRRSTTIRSKVGKVSRGRGAVDDDDEDEEDEDDEDEPVRSRTPKKRQGLAPGIRKGWDGAEATRKAGGGYDRIQLSTEPVLVKFLEPEPFVSARQHWVSTDGKGDRPYVCIGSDCPLCDLGDQTSAMFAFNVLHISEGEEPKVKILQISTKPFQALKETATDKRTNKILIQRGYWAVTKTGKKQQTQTNFRPVKERDIQDDWPEVLEHFDLEDMPDILKKASKRLHDESIIPATTRKQLRDIARYLADED